MVVAVTSQEGPRKARELQESHSGGETEVPQHRLALQLEKLAGPDRKGMWAGLLHSTSFDQNWSVGFPEVSMSLPGRKGL